jgi:integrase
LANPVFAETAEETLTAVAARAWFLTLAHTGMRLNELLDLRVAEVDFATRRILICNPKGGHDRIAFMTHLGPLPAALPCAPSGHN